MTRPATNAFELSQNDYDKLNVENARIRKQNDAITDEVKTLKEQLEMVSYQNKIVSIAVHLNTCEYTKGSIGRLAKLICLLFSQAHLLALIPITVLVVSIILAYLPILSIATGTKEV